jgi:immunoglobulin-binding protein 1
LELELDNRREGRFSKNDSHTDLVPEDAPFLLVDFMLAMCQELTNENRMNSLEIAKGLYFRYFERLIQYKILDPERPEAIILKKLLLEDHDDAQEQKLLFFLQRPTRDLKIERMKTIMRMKSSLPIPEFNASEELILAYWSNCLNFYALVALDNISLLLQEIELLQIDLKPEATESNPIQYDSKVSKISKPFKLVRDRKQMAADVFRPDYNLPTMTIDEYLDLEMKRGNIIFGGGAASSHKAEHDEDTEVFLEEQLRKDREFDEFKDSKKL